MDLLTECFKAFAPTIISIAIVLVSLRRFPSKKDRQNAIDNISADITRRSNKNDTHTQAIHDKVIKSSDEMETYSFNIRGGGTNQNGRQDMRSVTVNVIIGNAANRNKR